MNLDYNYWSKSFWNILEIIINNVNENNKINCLIVLNSIGQLLPCDYCNKHYNNYLDKNPLTYEEINKEYLNTWLMNLKKQIKEQKTTQIKVHHNTGTIHNSSSWSFKTPSKGYTFNKASCVKCMEKHLVKNENV